MIYDCFNFLNELELLDIRLHELNEVVDRFVLVESTVTFTNKTKPLLFERNKELFKPFLNKIIHIIVKDSPNVLGNPWIIEMHQFNAITKGLVDCRKGDMILLSNVDEIPKAETVKKWKEKSGVVKAFNQSLYYYFLNCRAKDQNWVGTRMVTYEDLLSFPNPYVIRHSPTDVLISDGGWHFSFVGGVDRIREKIFSFAHQEYNNPKFNTVEKIKLAMLTKSDLFNRGYKFEVEYMEELPKYVQQHPSKFSQLILSEGSSPRSHEIIYWKLRDILRTQVRKMKR